MEKLLTPAELKVARTILNGMRWPMTHDESEAAQKELARLVRPIRFTHPYRDKHNPHLWRIRKVARFNEIPDQTLLILRWLDDRVYGLSLDIRGRHYGYDLERCGFIRQRFSH